MSREEVLARIAAAVPPATRPPIGAVVRRYRGPSGRGSVEAFAERVADYRATVTIADASGVREAVAAALDRHGARRVVVPAGLDPAWVPAGIEVVGDDPPLRPAELDVLDGVLSGCALAVAETGTIVLDHGPGQGRRALSLVPDLHVVVVPATSIVAGVPDAVAACDPDRPLTWVSGPSATSDIELDRVEGVHGPRQLEVVVVTGGAGGAGADAGVAR